MNTLQSFLTGLAMLTLTQQSVAQSSPELVKTLKQSDPHMHAAGEEVYHHDTDHNYESITSYNDIQSEILPTIHSLLDEHTEWTREIDDRSWETIYTGVYNDIVYTVVVSRASKEVTLIDGLGNGRYTIPLADTARDSDIRFLLQSFDRSR